MSVKIKLAVADVEKDAVYQGRYKVYVEEMGVMPQREDGRVIDYFDTFAKTANIACYRQGRIVGGVRLTIGGDVLGTPADFYFDYASLLPENALPVSTSMLFLEQEFRGHPQLLMGMFLMGYFWAVSKGGTHLLAPVNPPVGRNLKRVGFEQVGEDFEHHGLPIRPMLWDLKKTNSMFSHFVDVQKYNTFAHNYHSEFFESGEYMIRQGDKADAAFVVLEGEGKVLIRDGSGQEREIGIIGPGDLVGEVALLAQGRRTASVRATTPLHAVVFDRERFQEKIVADPDHALRLLGMVGRRLTRFSDFVSKTHPLPLENGDQEEVKVLGPIKLEYNPAMSDLRSNPYPVYSHIREREPVHFNPLINAWMVFGFEECKELLMNPNISSKRAEAVINKAPPEVRDKITTFRETANNMLLFLDPPEHRRKRALTSKAFSMRMVRKLEPQISALLDDIIADLKKKETFDLVADLAYPLPLNVIGDLLGVPEPDRGYLKECSQAMSIMVAHPRPDAESVLRGNKAIDDMYGYFKGLIAERRKQPGEDLISQLIQVEESGDLLTEPEILINACLFLFAGHETTTNLLGSGALNLLRHPEEMQKIRETPDLLEKAVEEMLRFDSPIQLVTRVAKEDVEIAGCTIKKGDVCYAVLGAANRDPKRFPDPDTFDIQRDNVRHIAFGFGEHFCLGSPLARLEAKLAFSKLLEAFPNLSLADEEPEWRPDIANRGLSRLMVRGN